MAKKNTWQSYMKRMNAKEGATNGASSASTETWQSYVDRAAAKNNSGTYSTFSTPSPQKQRKIVQSVRGNITTNTSGTKDNVTNKLTKGTKIDAADINKFSGQSIQNLDTDRYVQNQVDSYKKPTVTDAIKNHNKTSYNTKPLGSYISTALKSSGNPTGKDPDSLYRTDDMAEETLNAYREAARKDSKNPLNIATKGGKGSETYNYMSDAEKNRYNEIYGVYGSKQAEEYKALMEDVINERIGQANYKNKYADSNALSKTAYQLGRGFGSGVEGVGRAGAALIGLTNSHANSPAEYTAAAMRNDEKNSSIENAVYDIANSTGYMLPGMIASTVAAPVAGAAAAGAIGNSLFALAQYGNTYREDINAGRSAGKSQLHALQQGIDEMATNWLLGGIGAFGGGTLTKVFKDTAVGKAFKNGVSKLTSNPTARRLLTSFAEYLTDAGSEAAQEYTQYYTNAITENLLFDVDNDLSLTNSEAWYSALLGGLNAMVLNAPNYAQRTASDVNTIREGLKPELNTSEGLTALAENIANNDAASQNDALHEMSNETFDKVMEMNNRIENGQKVSAIEKGEAAIAARNIEAVSKMENTMRQAVEARETAETREKATEEQKQAAEEQSLAAVRETDNSKIADNKAGFEEYTAENAAGLYSEDSRNNMVSLYDGTVDADRYRQAYQRAYTAGFNNIDEKTAYNSMNMLYLNNEQKLQAYKDGMRDSNLYASKKLEYEQGEAREGGFIEGADKVNESTGKFLDWAGKKTGVKIQIAEGLKGAAEINLDKGVMKINPYSENFVGSASHELTHLIKLYDKKSFDKLQRLTVESMMKSNNMSYEELYAKYEKSYREQASADYTVEDILEEITADGATAYLNDADFAERVVKEDRGLGKKIADFFKEIADTLKAIINERGIRAVGKVMRENEARYRTAANIWYQALENAGTKYKEGYTAKETDTDTDAGAIKFQIAESDNGVNYVQVDVDQEMFDNLTSTEKIDFAKALLKERFKGKVLSNDTIDAVLTNATYKKYGRHAGNDESLDAKSRVSTVLDQIFRISKLVAHEANKGNKHESAVNGWDYYRTLFKIGNDYFSADFVVRKDIEKNVIYDLEKINKVDIDNYQMLEPSLEDREFTLKKNKSTFVTDNIASKADKDNTKFQLFDEPIEYTKDLIAVRNVNSDNLASMLELEGMPSPSIAITKDNLGHTQFGDVTFIFGRDTIDPEADSRNMVFTADAWDEVKLALVPDDIDAALIEQMREAGISDIRTYPAGDNEARAEMESKADNLKFQLNIDDDPEWNYYTNMVQEANQETRDAADTLGELLSAVDYMPSNKAIERTAKRLKKYTETDTSIEEIQNSIKTVFNYIANNEQIDGREISTVLADYAGELISNSHKVEVNPVEQKLFREFRNTIKGHTFHMPKGFEGEIRTLGGIRNIRSQSGLAINITKDKGVPIDTLYDELSDMYPDYFDRDVTNPADQLERIIDKYNELRPKPSVSYANEEDYDAFRYYAGQEVFKAYIAEGAAEAGHKAEYRALQNTYKKKLKENAKSEKEMAALQSKAAEMQAKYLSELEASRKKVDKQTHNERIQAARKSMKTRYWKDQIMKDAKELSNWLLKPTDKKHVPEALREPLANFLTQLDFTSLNLAENGEPTQRSIYWMQLKDTWAKIAQNGGMAEGENGTQYMVIDTDILEKMSQLTDKIKGIKKLEELEYIDALKLNDVMKAMKHSIETANQMISLNRSVQSVATGTLEDLKEVHDNVDLGRLRGVKELLNNQMLDADTRFHTFGKNAESVYKAVRLGFNKKVKHVKESADWFAELVKQVQPTKKDWKGKASAESTVKSWSEDTLTIKLSSGKDLKLTVAQAMNLYNLLKRTQAREHILRGGITLTSFKDESTRKKKALKAYTNSVNEHVTQQDCLNIINALTPEQKRFADGLANSLQKAAQWGNETSMELMGYKKFNDRFYWPIKSSRDYIATSMDAAAAGGVVGVSVKNAGPTKNVVKKANNPILVGDIMDVWSDHINFMSNYNAFTIPLTDMVKWYNYVDYGDIREEGSDRYRNSVKQEIRRAYGSTADGYIMRFIEQINGTGNKGDKSVIKNLISMFKGSAVGFNLSVAIQQPTAIARAGAVIDAKYLVGGLTARDTADWETIKKYSAIAQWKDWGFFDTNISKSMKSILTGGNTFIEDMGEKQMWLAGKGDEITWKRMWAAAELKVRAEHQELERGSEAYYKKTAEIFDEIIDKTQVVDSVFTKSDLMRSDNELNKMATSFFSEPTKSYNMMYRAWFDWHTAKYTNEKATMAKQLRRATVCWLLSNVFAAMAKSIVTAMRDDDEDRDKAFWDRWVEHTSEEMVGNINPFNYIPWVKDVISVFEGYSVNRSDMQGVEDMYYAASRWAKYFNGESKYTLGNNILYSTKALSSFTGVAFYGAQRDINALIDTAIEAVGADRLNYEKQKLTGLSLGSSNNVNYYLSKAMQAYKEDHKALGDKIVSDVIKAGISEDKINDKKKTLLKANEDMQSLIDDTLSGNEQAADKTRAALIKQGYSDDMIDSVLKSGINTSMEDGGLTYAGLNETLDSITDYTKAGFKEFDETYKEWAEAAKIKNGWDDKKCREQFRSQCTKYFKPKYQEGNSAERSRILNILSRVKSTDGTRIYAKDEDIKKWGK